MFNKKIIILLTFFISFLFIVKINGEGATYQFEKPPPKNSSDLAKNSLKEEGGKGGGKSKRSPQEWDLNAFAFSG
uniref:Uncharacterized protein n=1 Tax=Meloidogyne enterolobii TaxID=390850 RepID=A0A6V7VIQ5_MELEN|nr:unnamed protein product [Meloidogyne enterolobii]